MEPFINHVICFYVHTALPGEEATKTELLACNCVSVTVCEVTVAAKCSYSIVRAPYPESFTNT